MLIMIYDRSESIRSEVLCFGLVGMSCSGLKACRADGQPDGPERYGRSAASTALSGDEDMPFAHVVKQWRH